MPKTSQTKIYSIVVYSLFHPEAATRGVPKKVFLEISKFHWKTPVSESLFK